ncbi:P-loop containing nucleoside triphosphate hydrolase protein [Ochromonadaceae sp. CCMP2298]|nr:P-loop containing nucleoside triphosphate hydrolase protein [Ochromonadaceae sp. CCMP2298]
MGMQACTTVQSVVVPNQLQRRQNMLIKSQTGSGKTLAFLLPMVHDLMQMEPRVGRADGCHALVIAPTRELCTQITEVLNKITQCCVNLVSGSITGGERKKSEKGRLRKGVVLLVGTPGRLLDHLQSTESFHLDKLRWIVMDEVDRLLDMGERQIEGMWNINFKTKQCSSAQDLVLLMCSATLTNAVKHLALPLLGNKAMKGSAAGVVGKKSGGAALAKGEAVEAPAQLNQYFMMVTCKWRLAALLSFLRTHTEHKVVVFLATCDSVDYISLLLREMDWPTELDPASEPSDKDDGGTGLSSLSMQASQTLEPLDCRFQGMFDDNTDDAAAKKSRGHLYRLHGSVPQQVRKTVYTQFCAASKGVLLCTDVAARGLDLPNVDWILQYDAPCETTDYVHRIGRTARKGRTGSALLFLLPSEASYIPMLSGHGLNPQALSLQSLFLDSAKHIPGAAKFKNIDEMTAVILQRRVERVIHDNKWLLLAGRQAFRSFVRAYATHSVDTRGIFSVQLLHLGHVAKSFGLRESPKNLRSSEDVIGKIFNGAYSSLNPSHRIRQENRQEGGGGGGGQVGDKRKLGQDGDSSKVRRSTKVLPAKISKPSTQNPGLVVKSGKDRQQLRRMGTVKNKTKGKGGALTATGAFRKTTGYFKKQLRSQATSEFSK